MTPGTSPDDDSRLSEHLLNKADALIHRHRPGGVGTDAEEIPVLVDAIEDLPELTDEFVLPPTGEGKEEEEASEAALIRTQINPEALVEAQEADTETLPEPEPTAARAPRPDQLREAVEAARREMLEDMLAEQDRAVQEAIERTRAENKAMQSRAVQAAYAQGKEEAEINYWPAMQEARKEALQTAAMSMSEHLITLDAYIAQAVEAWLARELPQIISGEIDAFVSRLKEHTISHMRATLVPDISEKISVILDDALKPTEEE